MFLLVDGDLPDDEPAARSPSDANDSYNSREPGLRRRWFHSFSASEQHRKILDGRGEPAVGASAEVEAVASNSISFSEKKKRQDRREVFPSAAAGAAAGVAPVEVDPGTRRVGRSSGLCRFVICSSESATRFAH